MTDEIGDIETEEDLQMNDFPMFKVLCKKHRGNGEKWDITCPDCLHEHITTLGNEILDLQQKLIHAENERDGLLKRLGAFGTKGYWIAIEALAKEWRITPAKLMEQVSRAQDLEALDHTPGCPMGGSGKALGKVCKCGGWS